MKYTRCGPFANGSHTPITATFLNGIEDFLVSLSEEIEQKALTEIRAIGSTTPLGWMHRETGEFIQNPDTIAPALPPEPVRYEQALVDYEICEKASR